MVSIFLAFRFFAKNEKFKAIFREKQNKKREKLIFFNFCQIFAIFEDKKSNITESLNFWLVIFLKTLFFAQLLPFFKVDYTEELANFSKNHQKWQ